MKNVPILKYKDLRLEVMGDDECRYLWIELKAPGKKYRDEEADRNGNYWYQVLTANYKGFHYLLMSNSRWKFIDLRSAESVGAERRPDVWHGNVKKSLLKLEAYVTALVDEICQNPDDYNSYVEQHLPYTKRHGRIKRADLNRICPDYRTFENPKHTIEVLKGMKSMPLWTADKMNLRTYMHVWRIAYEAYRTMAWFEPTPKSAFVGKTDMELFEHNSKGREAEDYDLDSEEAYQKWEDENSHYHCMDVAYARIHLFPVKKGDPWDDKDVDVPDGKWYLRISYSVYGYSRDVVNILEAFQQAGIGVVCDSARRILQIAEETDYVSISPMPDKHHRNEEEGNEISLPYVDEDTTQQQIDEIIAAAEWIKQKEALPI